MLAFLSDLWARAQGWVVGIGAAFLAAVGIYAAGRKAGSDAVKTEALKKRLEEKGKADDVAEKISAMDDRAVLDAARRWVRDDTDE